MDLLDVVWHVLNFFVPALGVGTIGAAGAKLLWRRELVGVTWLRLAGFGVGAGAVALVAGLLVFGRDGRMATYGMLIVANALALWGAGFGPLRR